MRETVFERDVTIHLGITAAIIAVPQHATFLFRLTAEILRQLGPRDELVLILSGFDDDQANFFASSTPPSVRIVRSKLQSSGANRNLAFSVAEKEVVAFHDADDSYHPRRIEAIREIFTVEPTVAFYHSFDVMSADCAAEDWVPLDLATGASALRCLGENVFLEKTVVEPSRNRRREISHRAIGTDLVFSNPNLSFPIHHGHGSFLRAIYPSFRYHEFPEFRNEDGVFARDILEAELPIRVSPFVLSHYRAGSTASPLFSIGSRFRRKFGQAANLLFSAE